ncbi:hypothetical protein NPIL_653571, partial [Nephila pilipes]
VEQIGKEFKKRKGKKRTPVTILEKLVMNGRIKSLEKICVYSLQIKEHEIMELFFKSALECAGRRKMPIRKQIRAMQRKRFKDNYAKIGEPEELNEALSSADQI